MVRYGGRQQPVYDCDGSYIPLPRPQDLGLPTTKNAQGGWTGGKWIASQSGTLPACNKGGRLSPIVIKDDSDSDCYEVPAPASRELRVDGRAEPFNFNDIRQDVPWVTSTPHSRRCEVCAADQSTYLR